MELLVQVLGAFLEMPSVQEQVAQVERIHVRPLGSLMPQLVAVRFAS